MLNATHVTTQITLTEPLIELLEARANTRGLTVEACIAEAVAKHLKGEGRNRE